MITKVGENMIRKGLNKKGFTLVELLATLTILSIIMLVAVPSTMSIIDKNRKETFLSDAKRFTALAESQIRNNDRLDVNYGGVIVFRLKDLNDGTFDKDPDGGNYDQNNSYVAVYKSGNPNDYQFIYYVQIKGSKRGVPLTAVKNVTRNVVAKINNATLENTIGNKISSDFGRGPTQFRYFSEV